MTTLYIILFIASIVYLFIGVWINISRYNEGGEPWGFNKWFQAIAILFFWLPVALYYYLTEKE
jgi:hypothetical protein